MSDYRPCCPDSRGRAYRPRADFIADVTRPVMEDDGGRSEYGNCILTEALVELTPFMVPAREA